MFLGILVKASKQRQGSGIPTSRWTNRDSSQWLSEENVGLKFKWRGVRVQIGWDWHQGHYVATHRALGSRSQHKQEIWKNALGQVSQNFSSNDGSSRPNFLRNTTRVWNNIKIGQWTGTRTLWSGGNLWKRDEEEWRNEKMWRKLTFVRGIKSGLAFTLLIIFEIKHRKYFKIV